MIPSFVQPAAGQPRRVRRGAASSSTRWPTRASPPRPMRRPLGWCACRRRSATRSGSASCGRWPTARRRLMELADMFGVAKTTMHHHMIVLRSAGLVTRRRRLEAISPSPRDGSGRRRVAQRVPRRRDASLRGAGAPAAPPAARLRRPDQTTCASSCSISATGMSKLAYTSWTSSRSSRRSTNWSTAFACFSSLISTVVVGSIESSADSAS